MQERAHSRLDEPLTNFSPVRILNHNFRGLFEVPFFPRLNEISKIHHIMLCSHSANISQRDTPHLFRQGRWNILPWKILCDFDFIPKIVHTASFEKRTPVKGWQNARKLTYPVHISRQHSQTGLLAWWNHAVIKKVTSPKRIKANHQTWQPRNTIIVQVGSNILQKTLRSGKGENRQSISLTRGQTAEWKNL